jgi:hypothetical protein
VLVADGALTTTQSRTVVADHHVSAVDHCFDDQRRSGSSDIRQSDHGWWPATDCQQLLAHVWFVVPAGGNDGSMQRNGRDRHDGLVLVYGDRYISPTTLPNKVPGLWR